MHVGIVAISMLQYYSAQAISLSSSSLAATVGYSEIGFPFSVSFSSAILTTEEKGVVIYHTIQLFNYVLYILTPIIETIGNSFKL